jgi:hypothetical protein
LGFTPFFLLGGKPPYPVVYATNYIKDFKYTILPEPIVHKALFLRIEFVILKDVNDAMLSLSLPGEFLIEFPENVKIEKEEDTYKIFLGSLKKDKMYIYNFKLRITKTGYWGSPCRLDAKDAYIDNFLPKVDSSICLLATARFIKVTEKGGRIENWDFETLWKRIRYYLFNYTTGEEKRKNLSL